MIITDAKTGRQRRYDVYGLYEPDDATWGVAQEFFEARLRAEEQAQQVRAENPGLFIQEERSDEGNS